MTQIIDFSFFIVALAILGFVIKDVFNSNRKYTTPYDITKDSEKMFSYISFTLLLISIFWIIFVSMILPSFGDIVFDENINPIFKIIEYLHETGIMSDVEYSSLTKQAILSIFYLTFFSFFYVGLYIFVGLLGSISNYFDTKAVHVIFRNQNTENKDFRRIIYESTDFIYFEDFDNFTKWHAIKKEDITKIESQKLESKADNKILSIFKKWLQNNKYFKRSEIRYGGISISFGIYIISIIMAKEHGIGVLFPIGLIFAVIACLLLFSERYFKNLD